MEYLTWLGVETTSCNFLCKNYASYRFQRCKKKIWIWPLHSFFYLSWKKKRNFGNFKVKSPKTGSEISASKQCIY